MFHNEITAFISSFSLKLCHFRKASYYAAWCCTSEPQHRWVSAQLMDTARMCLTDRPTQFVRTKSTYIPKEAWYNWRRLMGGKTPPPFISSKEGEKLGQENERTWSFTTEAEGWRTVHLTLSYIHKIYTCMKFENEKNLESKQHLGWSTKLTGVTPLKALMWLSWLAAVGERRINNFPKDWQERQPVKTETASLEFISSCPRNTQHTLLFPF